MNTLVRLNNRRAPAFAEFPALDDLFAGFFRPVADMGGNGIEPIRIEVTEDANAYRVAAAIPGVKKEDIHVNVDGNEVSIVAEIKRETNAKEGEKLLHSERFYGKTSRTFNLGLDIDEANVSAKYNDGVLNLVLPKKVSVSAKRIAVE
ncbi:MAG TPA: Hsp20/alpha crystallin family protein [Usitatibacteraceae bacterium]|nr:Hsp20/alpha crystallin family protein [Usitatibacteraceae bacterium]